MAEQTEQSEARARGGQKGNLNGMVHGLRALDRRLRQRSWREIDSRTAEGRQALAFRDDALARKGGDACPYYIKAEIKLATFDYFRLLHVQAYLNSDAQRRGTPVNRRRHVLGRLHEQYTAIETRFTSRLDRLNLDASAQGLDLAKRIQFEQLQNSGGAEK
jgi:hypothetical protein